MFQREINGIDLSLDFGYVSVLERTEQAYEKYKKNHYDPVDAKSGAEITRHYCNEIIVAINEIYKPVHGDGVCERIFDDPRGVSFDAISGLFNDILNALNDYQVEMWETAVESARRTKARQDKIAAMKEEVSALNEQNAEASAQIAEPAKVTRFPGASYS